MLFVETRYQKSHRSDTGPVNLRMTEIEMILSLASALLLMQAAPAAVDGAAASADADKKICKREKQIGSLVRAKKICSTKAEWDSVEAQARQDVGEIQRTTRAPANG